jgi:hypothetical protein
VTDDLPPGLRCRYPERPTFGTDVLCHVCRGTGVRPGRPWPDCAACSGTGRERATGHGNGPITADDAPDKEKPAGDAGGP